MSLSESLKVVLSERFWARSLIHLDERDEVADVIEYVGAIQAIQPEWFCDYHEARAGAKYCRYGLRGEKELCSISSVRIVPWEVWGER